MRNLPVLHKGASAIGTMIFLTVAAYAIFLGVQYAPQFLESVAIDSVLRTMKSSQDVDPVTSETMARKKIGDLLQMNDLADMSKHLTIRSFNGKITIKFEYERELNLGYRTRKMNHDNSLVLNFEE